MKSAIRERARELGFDQCRFTTAEPPDSAVKFHQWIAEGNHGEMLYLERNAAKRAEPDQVLAGAKTIIVLAVNYHSSSPLSPRDSRDFRGTIARYAQYRDYHNLFAPALKSLTEFVTDLGPADTRSLWYVDTGPLLERALGQRAGIGFAGKHTNLISRQLGNWFLLAEIITTLPLEPDPSQRNLCGSCTRCITACPTGAITAPFQLDARRCISYLTIELRGSIPDHLRPAVGNRIFGCDDCLQVCPWNRFAREASQMLPHRRQDLSEPDLLELLALDDAAFKQRFQDTPILRTKRRGFLRNVCVALGNVGDARALPALQKAQADPEPLIAEHAAWAIRQIQARTENASIGSPGAPTARLSHSIREP